MHIFALRPLPLPLHHPSTTNQLFPSVRYKGEREVRWALCFYPLPRSIYMLPKTMTLTPTHQTIELIKSSSQHISYSNSNISNPNYLRHLIVESLFLQSDL